MKKHLPIIIAFILLSIGFFVYYNFVPRLDIGSDEALLIIDFGETKRFFAGETIEGMTAFDALLASLNAGEFDFEFNFNKGRLKRINKFEENKKSWNFYFNGIKTEDFLDQTLIKAGDKIELKFE